MRSALATGVLTLAALTGCASDSPLRSEPSTRQDTVRPESTAPEGLTDIRSELAGQRATTQAAMNPNTPTSAYSTADDGSPWYSPFFDALDIAAGLSRFFPW